MSEYKKLKEDLIIAKEHGDDTSEILEKLGHTKTVKINKEQIVKMVKAVNFAYSINHD